MDAEKDIWYRGAALVLVITVFIWALATTMNIVSEWASWIASTVITIAMASVVIRAGLRNKDVIWTERLNQEQRHRVRQMLLKMIPTLLLGLSGFVPISLVRGGVLPQWAGGVLFFSLIAGWIGLRWVLRRGTVPK